MHLQPLSNPVRLNAMPSWPCWLGHGGGHCWVPTAWLNSSYVNIPWGASLSDQDVGHGSLRQAADLECPSRTLNSVSRDHSPPSPPNILGRRKYLLLDIAFADGPTYLTFSLLWWHAWVIGERSPRLPRSCGTSRPPQAPLSLSHSMGIVVADILKCTERVLIP